jgi:hypothetical protein
MVLALILMGTFYVLSLVDDESVVYWRVLTGVVAFCLVETVAVALL